MSHSTPDGSEPTPGPRLPWQPIAEPTPVQTPPPVEQTPVAMTEDHSSSTGSADTEAPPTRAQSRREAMGHAGKSRTRLVIVIAVIGIVVLIAGGVALAVVLTRDGDPAVESPAATVTVTVPPPTATVAPADVPAATEFEAALPAVVDPYSVQSETAGQAAADPSIPGILAGPNGVTPVESYTRTYTDGTTTVTLDAVQWQTAEDSNAVLTAATQGALAADGSAAMPQPVDAGGATVGSVVVQDISGQEVVTWTNGTALFRVVGPPGAAVAFYQAFPL